MLGTSANIVKHEEFNPYTDNGGTVIAIAGADYAIIASDTRLSEGYNILSRTCPKVNKINSGVVMGSAGMRVDMQRLVKNLKIEATEYRQKTGSEIGVSQFARLLGNTLYYKRFMPWYTFNIVAGLDATGKGAVYGYDAIGSTHICNYAASGAGESLIIGLLDEAIMPRIDGQLLTKDEAYELIVECFRAATEREISTGDSAIIHLITKDGVAESKIELRKD